MYFASLLSVLHGVLHGVLQVLSNRTSCMVDCCVMLRYAGRCRQQAGVVVSSRRTAKFPLVKRASAVPRSSQMVTQRPLLLVHGNFSQAWTWNDLKARLINRGYSVFTLDLQWQRKSNGELPGLQDHALQIADCIKHEGLRDVVLVGHSYGGVPVLQAAAGAPLRCMQRICR